MELREAQAEEIENRGSLGLRRNDPDQRIDLWKAAPSEPEATFSARSISEGCSVFGRENRTDVTLFIFNGIQTDRVENSGLVAQAVTGWNHILHSLQQIDLLRREGLFRAA